MSKPEFVYMTVIAAPPEEVWKGLTTAEFTRQYWHKTRVQSDYEPGGKIEFLNEEISEMIHNLDIPVLEYQPIEGFTEAYSDFYLNKVLE